MHFGTTEKPKRESINTTVILALTPKLPKKKISSH